MAPDRVLTVVYERLVSEPGKETNRICDFLGIEWCSQMLHPGMVKHPGESAIVNDVWYDRRGFNRDPVITEIDKWKRQLNARQQVAVTAAFRDSQELVGLG